MGNPTTPIFMHLRPIGAKNMNCCRLCENGYRQPADVFSTADSLYACAMQCTWLIYTVSASAAATDTAYTKQAAAAAAVQRFTRRHVMQLCTAAAHAQQQLRHQLKPTHEHAAITFQMQHALLYAPTISTAG
jgi:hypothetical protein